MKIDWYAIRDLAEEHGRPIKTLIALSGYNGPFYIGEKRMGDAEWFASLFREHGFSRGVHIRRVHYRLISQREPVLMPDGSDYENTDTKPGETETLMLGALMENSSAAVSKPLPRRDLVRKIDRQRCACAARAPVWPEHPNGSR